MARSTDVTLTAMLVVPKMGADVIDAANCVLVCSGVYHRRTRNWFNLMMEIRISMKRA